MFQRLVGASWSNLMTPSDSPLPKPRKRPQVESHLDLLQFKIEAAGKLVEYPIVFYPILSGPFSRQDWVDGKNTILSCPIADQRMPCGIF
jgi:hypothetical protein